MKIRSSRLGIGLWAITLVLFLSGGVMAGDDVTVTGKVNEDYQLVGDDGIIYEVDDNSAGNELIEHVGKKVKVEGTVTEGDGATVMTVRSYEMLEE
jgi:hypothetical protein